jgi:[ribosomal protein S5]-alanine N-acetyltransferase
MASFTDLRLQTDRLNLRPLQLADADDLFHMHSDPEFMRYWAWAPWTSQAQAVQLIESDIQQIADGQHVRLGLLRREDGRFVGTCSLFNLVRGCRRAEIGYGIVPAHWRQGYMAEAVGALIDWAFGPLGLNRLEADIDPRNTASARSLEKLGFLREGLLRERWIVNGEVSDSAIYGLLARQWRAGPG